MSKYYTYVLDYDTIPYSKDNFIKALIEIGKDDPKDIKKTSLCGKKRESGETLSKQELMNRGILNVRKQLNSHLGLSGKYTNRMIRLSSTVEVVKEGNNQVWLKSKLPKEDFKKIVKATYTILRKCDKKYCNTLVNDFKQDSYIFKKSNKNIGLQTIAPIQTNMIIRTIIGKNEKVTDFVEDFRNEAYGGK